MSLKFEPVREKSHAQHEKERRALGTDSNDAQAYGELCQQS